MTRQAVLRRLLIILSMTIDAPAHLELRDRHEISDMRIRNEMEFVEFFDWPVTRLTLDTRLDVTIVSKLDVVRKTVDLNPFDRLLLLPMILQDPNALDLVVFGGELGMTTHTEFDGRHARGLGFIRRRMAVETIDLEFSRMVFVAEGNRLHEAGRLFIECRLMGKTCGAARPRGIEFLGNLDFQLGIVFLERPEFVRFADTTRDEGFCACGRSKREELRDEARDRERADSYGSGEEVAKPRMVGGHSRTAGPLGVSIFKSACGFVRRPIADV